ncbi:MAG: ice-binding family protein [Candidatus Dormiibacterota bacterium]
MPKYSRRFGVIAAIAAGVALAALPTSVLANVAPPNLLTAANFAAIAGTGITNAPGTGTIIAGAAAVYPATAAAVTGFPPGTYTSLDADGGAGQAVALQAQTDLTGAYTEAANATPFTNLTGTNLGGLTLTPGVYRFTSNAQLTGILTLNGEGQTNPTFIFQMEAELTTASGSSVVFENGASGCALYWQVTSEATLGSTTSFQGNLMTQAGITMGSDSTIGVGGGVNGGRALVNTAGLLSMDTANLIDEPTGGCVYAAATTTTTPTSSTTTPTPGTGIYGVGPGGLPLSVIALTLICVGVLATSAGFSLRRNRA